MPTDFDGTYPLTGERTADNTQRGSGLVHGYNPEPVIIPPTEYRWTEPPPGIPTPEQLAAPLSPTLKPAAPRKRSKPKASDKGNRPKRSNSRR